MPRKNCVVCSVEFMARLSVYKTCGTVCRNRLIASEKEKKHTVAQACAICGTKFTNTGKQKRRKTCSRKCSHVLSGIGKQNQIIRNCATCGVEFSAEASRDAKYCSQSCMYARSGVVYVKTISKLGRHYLRQTPAAEVARNAKRRAVLIQATPKWADVALILAFYEDAQQKTLSTGVVYHVDHQVPLQSKAVCGLHTHDNLCVMVGTENLGKSNRSWPDMP